MEIEKSHERPLHSLKQEVTRNCPNVLGTALRTRLRSPASASAPPDDTVGRSLESTPTSPSAPCPTLLKIVSESGYILNGATIPPSVTFYMARYVRLTEKFHGRIEIERPGTPQTPARRPPH